MELIALSEATTCLNEGEVEDLRRAALSLATQSRAIGVKQGPGKHLVEGAQFVLQENNSPQVGNIEMGDALAERTLSTARIVWAGAAEPRLLELGRANTVLNAVSRVLGTHEASHLINQLHFKLSGDQVHFPWHQDLHNRLAFDPDFDSSLSSSCSFVQVITALEPHRADNGPLQAIPGSHKSGLLERDSQAFHDVIQQAAEEGNIVPLLLDAGETILCHPCTLHYSQPNEGGGSRLTFINGFCAVGANHGNYPGIGSGETIELS